MRLWGLVGVLFCLVGAPVAEAYYLDTPHNESNGIFCYTCHSMTEWWQFTPSGIDDTVRNAVCLRCHAEGSTDPLRGPSKKLHASSTTSTDKGAWTTECTQCHDVHSQGQLDWVGIDDARLYLATGTFHLANGPLTYVAGGNYTTIGFTGVTGQAGWTDPATWKAKGGHIDAGRAVDGSRGLILVPNKEIPTETFEIIDVIGNVLKVKGKITNASQGMTFGVIYGQSLKSYLLPNGGTTASDYRDVKFFQPTVLPTTFGGFVDETASAHPLGLCQVCHSSTSFWKTDGSNSTHNAGRDCGQCHNVLAGGAGSAEHATFIGDRLGSGCGNCHSAYVTNPDTAHANSCETCHTANRPEINTNPMANEGGVTVHNALDNGVYNFTPRLTDAEGEAISSPSFLKIDCGECHEAKPAALLGGTHGGHAATSFAWNGNCSDCHGPATLEVVKDVHGNTCTLCHDPAKVALGDYTVRREGDPSFGIDGDARTATLASGCTDCHGVNTPGAIHHLSAGGQAAAGNCAICHGTAGHEGNHTTLVADYLNCTTCHAANVGGSSGAPVDAGDNRIHDACVTCHNTDSTLKTLAQVGTAKVTAMPNGGAGTNNGGGTCVACHGEYFTKHANADHASRVAGATACSSCHTATSGTATGIPTNGSDNKVHDACATCHNSNGSLKSAYGKAVAMPTGGGTCLTCHGAYFPNHLASHATRVAATSNCSACHAQTAGLATGIPVNPADGKVHDACNTCHNDATTNLLKAPYGKAVAMAAGDCNVCHGAYFVNHINANHTTRVADTSNCNSCHPGTAGTATSVPVSVADNKVHDSCATCHNPTTGALVAASGKASAMPAGGGNCIACHGAYFASHVNADHTTRVAGLAACVTCHTGTAGTATTVPVGANSKLHAGCGTCHDTTSGVLLSKGVANIKGYLLGSMSAGDCGTCHTATYFNSHVHGSDTPGYVTHDLSHNITSDLAQNPGQPCRNCHNGNNADGNGIALDSWRDIKSEHLGSCATCHGYTNADGKNSPPPATNNSVIATGTAVKCLSCHTEKSAPATHGGHSVSDFPWDVTTRVSCGTVGCHDYAANPDVIMNIHGGTCTICHNNASGGDGTTIVGSATNGVDGNAQLGSTASPHTDNCLVCHPTATYDLSTVHHASKNGYATAGNCVQCHTGSNYPGDHSARVSLAGNCAGCHTGTQGTSSGIPLDATDATIAARKIHDACITCHNTDGDATLKTAYGRAQAMPNGGAGSNNGGGSCEACHTTGFAALHPVIDHSTRVSDSASCNTCHTATKGNASSVPVDATAHTKVHDACATCHNTSTGALLAAYGHAGAMPVGGGSCTACHTATSFTSLHDWATVDHSTKVTDTASCSTCHTTTKGTATGIALDATAHTKLHDACATCHSDTTLSVLKTAYGRAQAMATGACAGCHTVTSFTTMHNYTVAHTTQVADSASCNTCHTATKGSVSGIPVDATAHTKVHDSCATCHNDTTGALVAPTGHAGAMPVGGGACTACHTATSFTSLHDWATVDHSAKVTDSTSCNTCHTATKGTATGIPVDVTAHTKVHDSCATCHSDTTLAVLKTAYGHAGANATGSCTTCHNAAAFTTLHDYATVDHSTKVTDTASCATCHTTTKGTATGISLDATAHTKLHDACATCHSDTTLSVLKTAYGRAQAMATGACATCHTLTSFTSMHSYTVAHTTQVADSTSCNTCHTTTKGSVSGIPVDATAHTKVHDSCATCHNDTTGALVAPTGHAGAMPVGGGACTACHTATSFTSLHDWATVDHSTKVTNGTAGCNTSCHTTTAGTATGITCDATTNTKFHDACATCHSDTSLSVLKAPYGRVGAMATGVCVGCHTATSFTAMHAYANVAHDTKVTDSTSCNTCHTATKGTTTTIPVDATLHTKVHDSCATCHSTTSLTVLKAPYGLATAMATGSCVTCHTTASFTGLHTYATVDHSTKVTNGTAGCNTSCHTTTAGTATGITCDATVNTKFHDACTTCHSDTTLSVLKAAYGRVGAMATGACVGCHTATSFTALHTFTNVPHSTKVTGTATCITCHTGTAGTATTIPVSVADNKVHDTCATCHSDTTLAALKTAPIGTAAAMATGQCTTCHSTFAFANHSHSHDVAYSVTTDLSQAAPGTACGSCHVPTVAGNLNSWAGIYEEHLSNCDKCHGYTNADGLNSPPLATNNSVIATGTAVKCLTCHTEKSQPATHGNPHLSNDTKVTWDATCQSCHGTSTTPVAAVHSSTCVFCHVNPAGGGTLQTPLGSGAKTCSQCHGFTNSSKAVNIAGHHNYTKRVAPNANGSAMNGDCIRCHKPNIGTGSVDPATLKMGQLTSGRGLACNYCHMYWNATTPATPGYRNTSGKINIYKNVFNPNLTPRTSPAQTVLTTHTISKVTTGARITDFAACFACHGAVTYTGTVGTSTQVKPFHGMGHPYTGDNKATGGGLNTDTINMYMGPQLLGTGEAVRTTQVAPGPFAFNLLATSIGLRTQKIYTPAGRPSNAKYHNNDRSVHLPATSTYASANLFAIPWDNYAVAEPAAPQNITVNVGGVKNVAGSSVATNMPTVPLTLP